MVSALRLPLTCAARFRSHNADSKRPTRFHDVERRDSSRGGRTPAAGRRRSPSRAGVDRKGARALRASSCRTQGTHPHRPAPPPYRFSRGSERAPGVTGGPRRPQRAPGSNRRPQEAPESPLQLEAPGGPREGPPGEARRPQEAPESPLQTGGPRKPSGAPWSKPEAPESPPLTAAYSEALPGAHVPTATETASAPRPLQRAAHDSAATMQIPRDPTRFFTMLREGTAQGRSHACRGGATLAPSRAGVDRKERPGAARFFPAEPRGAPTRTDPHHRHIGLAGRKGPPGVTGGPRRPQRAPGVTGGPRRPQRAPGSNRRPQEAPEGPRE